MSTEPETPYVKCKHVKLFNDTLVKFFDELRQAEPSLKPGVKCAYKHYRSSPRKKYIQDLMTSLAPHMQVINQEDMGMFSDDYPFLQDLATVFQVPDSLNLATFAKFSADVQKATLLHLRALYACAGLALQQIGVFDESMEAQRAIFAEMVNEAQLEPDVKRKLEELVQQREEEEGEGDWLNPEKIKEMFGEGSVITELITEFVEEMSEIVDVNDPFAKQKLAAKVLSGKVKVKKLFNKMVDKIRGKLARGEITSEELLSQAREAQNVVIENDTTGFGKTILATMEEKMKTAAAEDADADGDDAQQAS